MRTFLLLLSALLPWEWRRSFLEKQFGFQIHPTARLGLCWLAPSHLVMAEGSSIGHLTVVKNLELLQLGAHATIGRGNWITGFPLGNSPHFATEVDRHPQLIIGEHSAITHRHLFDCTNTITIGRFTTIAGFQSQFLTHTIDLQESRQTSRPISLGDYCFVGTNCVALGGSSLADYCVLGAKSLLNKVQSANYRLYGGVPAKDLGELPRDAAYFLRTQGFVV